MIAKIYAELLSKYGREPYKNTLDGYRVPAFWNRVLKIKVG